MVDRKKLSGQTPTFVLLQYLKECYPDKYPVNDLGKFQRGRYAGIVEIQRFLEDICNPSRGEEKME